jgi:hypothetical protein
MYHFRDDTSPNALVWEEIDISGVLGVQMDSPVHSGEGIIHPIRVAPDGSLVILGSGRLYDAISLVQVDTLSNDIDDAVWADGILYTLRPLAGHSQVQKWDQPNWGVGAARVVDGSPIRLFVARDKLLVVTLQDGKPRFTISNLDLAMIFANGFESGDTSAWSATGGAFAGFLTAHGGAAANGAFGAEAMVGASCTAEENLLITPPPAIVQGTFFACSTVAAEAVEVGAAGATFAAGHSVSLGSAFSVPEGGVFTAAIDTATLSGLAYVEDDSPDRIGCYNTRLSLNIDGLTLASGDRIDHLVGYSSDGEVQFQVALLWNVALGENRLALTVRRDNGTFATTLGGEELIAPAGWMTLELAWRTGSGDGYFLASVNGDPFVGLDGLDNDLQTLDQIRWGNVGGVVTTSAGSLLLDDFESWE